MSNITINAPAAPKKTPSQRFTELVMREYQDAATGAAIALTPYQKQLIGGYYMIADQALKDAERKRTEPKIPTNSLPYTWENVNLNGFALAAVDCVRKGLDMTEKNHVFPIPYNNTHTKKYDITLMVGYVGKEIIARNFAVTPFKASTVELVYSTDKFLPIKKSRSQPFDTYDFEITNAFDRGEIVGGFGYIEYDDPAQNKLIIMSLKDILKRSAKKNKEFWGEFEDGKPKQESDVGWFAEMCLKAVKREVYSSKYVPIDKARAFCGVVPSGYKNDNQLPERTPILIADNEELPPEQENGDKDAPPDAPEQSAEPTTAPQAPPPANTVSIDDI